MSISANNNYEKVDVLFGDKSFLDTETFFKRKGLIKQQKTSLVSLIINKFIPKA